MRFVSTRGGVARRKQKHASARFQTALCGSGTPARERGNLKAVGSGGHALIAFVADDETAVLLAALVGELGVLLLGHLRERRGEWVIGGSGRCPLAVFSWHRSVVGTAEKFEVVRARDAAFAARAIDRTASIDATPVRDADRALARTPSRPRGRIRVPRVRTEVYTSLSSRSSTVSRRFVPFSRSDLSWLAAAAAFSALLAPRREGLSMTEERDSPRSFAPIRAFVRGRVRSHDRARLVRIGCSHLEKYLKK